MLLLLVSCVSTEDEMQRRDRARRLAADLATLSPTVSKAEAQKLASTAVERSAELQRQWRPMHIAWANNALINMCLQPRGLCYHWRDDTYPPLHHLHLRTLDVHLAAARRATPREHNALVITAHGQPFEEGIVLDGWRSGGPMAWKHVKKDKYPWKPLPWEITPMELRPLIMPDRYPTPPAANPPR
ncbi:MAG: hypothetical protein IPK32_07720 [Verrucomicrobiaceae bacterium]|nr:hypothetical protein [Verrucomicrobiaceae bacterium]